MAENYGPLLKARERLTPEGTWDELRSDLIALCERSNLASDSFLAPSEYLVAHGHKEPVMSRTRPTSSSWAVAARALCSRCGWPARVRGVVMVDRDELGSDTLSTHALFPNAIARLDSLGLLAPLLERHEVPWARYRLRVLGHESIGTFTPVGGFDRMIAPRRPALDRVLGEAAHRGRAWTPATGRR